MTALVGTGLATLVVALTGVAGLSGDLQAAAAKNAAPALTPGEELHDTHTGALVLRDACAKTHHKKKSGDDVPSTTPTTPGTTPASATSSREF